MEGKLAKGENEVRMKGTGGDGNGAQRMGTDKGADAPTRT